MKLSIKKNKKKIILIFVLILVLAALIIGAVALYRYRVDSATVEVFPVTNINMYMGDSSSEEISGYVTSTKSQEVVLTSKQTVKEVLVKKGQKVEAGTELLRLDTEEKEINLELKGLEVQESQQKISKLTKQIQEIQTSISTASSQVSFSSESSSTTQSTTQELQEELQDKQTELSSAQIDLKEKNLEYTKIQKEIQNATITSTIAGTVTEIQDPSTYVSGKGKTFLKIVSEDGLYLEGSVSELKLTSIEVGDVLTAQSWDTGEEFTATVTEVSPYPLDGNSMSDGSSGNPNASYYPFKAYIENTEGVSSGEYVTIVLGNSSGVSAEDGVYLPPAYIRKDGNKSYVYIRGDDDLLKKQYITTGKSSYGISVEVLEGVTQEDMIAFPYGKNVKEGARTKVNEEGGFE